MEYKKIVAITGLNGLFELLSSKTDGAIVKSLEESNTRFVASRIHHFSHLETIEVFTVKENVNLIDIFKAMEQSTEPLPDIKSNPSVKKYFETVYPDLDFQRVYTSDMKKIIKWFDLLQGKVEFKLTESSEKEPITGEEQTEQPVSEVAEQNPGEGKPA